MSNQVSPEQKVVLTLKDLQEVLNYISSRPFSEVFNIVETLKKARTFESVVAEQTASESKPALVPEVV